MAFVDPDFVDPDEAKPVAQEPSTLEKTGQFLKQATRFTPPAMALKIAQKSGELLEEGSYRAGGAVTDLASRAGASPEVAAGAGAAAYSVPNALLAFAGPGGAASKYVPLKDLVKMGTLREGRELGLGVPPSAVGSGHTERWIESLGGKADIARDFSERNREAIQVVMRREAGVPKDQPITEETLAAARDQIAQPYRAIAEVSPQASAALEGLKQARAESKIFWQHYNRSADPASLKKAQAMDIKAEAFETKIANLTGELAPDLLPALKEARVQLAKNYDIEKALNVGTGEVNARMIGNMVNKRGTKAITGDMATVGKFAQAFPDFVQPKAVATDVSYMRPVVSALGLSLGLGYGGYEGGKHMTGSPYGVALAALPFLSPAARSIALSKMMQSEAPLSGILQRPVQAGMVPLSKVGEPEPGRQ